MYVGCRINTEILRIIVSPAKYRERMSFIEHRTQTSNSETICRTLIGNKSTQSENMCFIQKSIYVKLNKLRRRAAINTLISDYYCKKKPAQEIENVAAT